jgi:hypothetical protein
MWRLLLTALAAVVLFTASARAENYRLLGQGGVSCDAWTANRASGRLDTWLPEGSWVLGFLSGIGEMGGPPQNYDPLRGMDADGVTAWLDTYCRTHPPQKLIDAARAFVFEHPH